MTEEELKRLQLEVKLLRAVVGQLCSVAFSSSKVSVEIISALFHVRAGESIPKAEIDELISAITDQMTESKKANDMFSGR